MGHDDSPPSPTHASGAEMNTETPRGEAESAPAQVMAQHLSCALLQVSVTAASGSANAFVFFGYGGCSNIREYMGGARTSASTGGT